MRSVVVTVSDDGRISDLEPLRTHGGKCAKHRAEHDAWLMPSPVAWRAMSGEAGFRIVQIGIPTVASVVRARSSAYDTGRALQRFQLTLINDSCAAGEGCSSRPEEAFTALVEMIRLEAA
jgi:hypothetical protein